jgi:hypothetical protein
MPGLNSLNLSRFQISDFIQPYDSIKQTSHVSEAQAR